MKYLILGLLILFFSELPGQSDLIIEEIMKGPDFVGQLPDRPFWSSDSRTIYFQWNQDSLPDEEIYSYLPGDSEAVRLPVEAVKSLESSTGYYTKDGSTKLYQKNGDLF